MHDWQEGVIGDLARGVRGVSYRPEHLLSSFASDAAVLLRATNIQGGQITFEDVQFVPKFIVSDEQRVNQHDIVVCMSNGSKLLVGKSAPCKVQFSDVLTVGAFCSVFHPRPSANASFIAHVFNGEGFRRSIDVTLAGSAINNLRNGHLESFPCRIPKPEEQSRIAAVLDTVDEAIANTEAVIAKLRQVRAGLLHDLLTRGLGKNGQLRDPIAHPEQFQDSPLGLIPRGWDVETLEQITDPQAPICYGIVQVFDFVPNGVLVLAIRDLLGDYATGLHRTAPSIDANYARSRVRPGDVLISIKGTIGRIGLVPAHYVGNISRDLARVRPVDRISSAFLVHLFRSPLGQRTLGLAQVGTTRAELSIAPLKRIPFAFPQRSEQDQIAKILDEQDGVILAYESELAKLVQLKSGLMTDLLTGRVRVPEVCSAIGSQKSTSHL